mgnify:FL=1
MKNKKIAIIVLVLIVIIAAIIACVVIFNMPKEKPEDVLNSYISMINDKNYEGLYSMISTESKQNISQEDFLTRNENIYEGIDAVNINIEIQEISNNGNETEIQYKESMDTSAGKIEFTNTATLVKEDKEYKLDWSSAMIFPELRDTDRVRVSTIESERGEILDRNGNKLAENGTVSSIGIVPGKLGENRDEAISQISELTGISVDYINSQLSLSWVTDDTFVPIKTVAQSETDLKNQLLTISGVQINSENARVYPLGKEAAHLIGYVQEINAEELEEYADKNYTSTSIIGKSGLELAYEDTLRGIDGVEIYIQDENGNKLKTLAKQDKQDGEDVQLTIDSNLQISAYEQLKDDNGFFVIMNPRNRRNISSCKHSYIWFKWFCIRII